MALGLALKFFLGTDIQCPGVYGVDLRYMSVHSGGNIAAVLDRPTQTRQKMLNLFVQFGAKPTWSKAAIASSRARI